MSVSKKRSGFQITSVTSEYTETSVNQSATSPLIVVQSAASPQGSFSQPTTPSLSRKFPSQENPGQGVTSSRFRVVRLAAGRGEPYHRGRWTCSDFLEREERVGFRRVMDCMRHAHSLESLEMIGLDRDKGGSGVHMHGISGTGHHIHSKGTSNLLAQPFRGEGEGIGGIRPCLLHSGPPSPTHGEPISLRLLDSIKPMEAGDFDSAPPHPSVCLRNLPPPLQLDVDAPGRQSVPRVSQSQPSSPGSSCSAEDTFQFSLNPLHTHSAFSLEHTILHLARDASGSSNSLMAIDNKIEQAMDLVKNHLMLAVREEVELLRHQIKDLQERNAHLEKENLLLRSLQDTH